jgi:hypothetical protein
MSQNRPKNNPDADKKPVFLRGLKPSTKDWLDKQINRDTPSRPAVVREIVERARRDEESRRKR